MNRLKAIPQTYNGVQLRSKTEKLCAMELDRMGFRWEYEPEGVDLDGLWYLPDFWLPECKMFIECKGIWDPPSQKKVHALWKASLPLGITVGAAELSGQAIHFGLVRPTPGDVFFWSKSPDSKPHSYSAYRDAELEYSQDKISAVMCLECGRPWFFTQTGSYMCLNCNGGDGDHHMGSEVWWNPNRAPRPANQVWKGAA